MLTPALKFRCTISFSYTALPKDYPQGTSHELAAYIDKLNFSGNTEHLLETLCQVSYSVKVVPEPQVEA